MGLDINLKTWIKEVKKMSEILIVYYSYSGNTKKIAEIIKRKTGGDLFFTFPNPQYPKDSIDTLEVSKQQKANNQLPGLTTKLESLDSYKYIFIGTPNWWSTMTPPIQKFLNIYDLSNKRIIPFITHGGGGVANIVKDMKLICDKSIFLKELSVIDNEIESVEHRVEFWLNEILHTN